MAELLYRPSTISRNQDILNIYKIFLNNNNNNNNNNNSNTDNNNDDEITITIIFIIVIIIIIIITMLDKHATEWLKKTKEIEY